MTARTLTATAQDARLRLERFLTRAIPGLGAQQAAALLEGGRVRIRGKVARAGRVLWGNETIEVELPELVPVAAPDAPAVPILFEDARIVIVDKPAGLVVESEGRGRSVAEIVGARLGSLPGVAHRLDRETSGCLALAKSPEALALLKAAFENKQVEKRYLAIVLGEPPESQRLEGPYGRDPANPRKYTTRVDSARRAALRFEVKERLSHAALVEVKLETGRTHQIRVQLSEAGYPVLGDALYGADPSRSQPAAAAIGRQALHAFRLSLLGAQVESPLPEDFRRALELLRRA